MVISLVCHGELYRLRPAPDRLTRFYLAIAAGGAVGGVFVGVIAPAALGPAQELYIGMVAVGFLLLVTLYRDVAFPLYHGRPRWTWAAMVAAWFGLATMLWYQAQSLTAGALFWRRNFFGSVSVTLHDPELPNYRRLVMRHGVTKHGAQYLQGTYQRLPCTYYSPFTGVGLAITAYGASLGRDTPMRVGVVGLGAGALGGRLGEMGEHLWRLSRGEDERPVVSASEPKSLGCETTFDRDQRDPAVVRNTLLALSDRLAARLRRRGLLARGVSLKYRDAEFRTWTRAVRLAEPTELAEDLHGAALQLLERVPDRSRAVRLLGLSTTGLVHRATAPATQLGLFAADTRPRRTQLARAVDTLQERFGRGAVVRAALLPERDDAEDGK